MIVYESNSFPGGKTQPNPSHPIPSPPSIKPMPILILVTINQKSKPPLRMYNPIISKLTKI